MSWFRPSWIIRNSWQVFWDIRDWALWSELNSFFIWKSRNWLRIRDMSWFFMKHEFLWRSYHILDSFHVCNFSITMTGMILASKSTSSQVWRAWSWPPNTLAKSRMTGMISASNPPAIEDDGHDLGLQIHWQSWGWRAWSKHRNPPAIEDDGHDLGLQINRQSRGWRAWSKPRNPPATWPAIEDDGQDVGLEIHRQSRWWWSWSWPRNPPTDDGHDHGFANSKPTEKVEQLKF